MEHHRASRPPSQCWRLMMSKVQRDGPRGTLSVLQILPQWITSSVQKQWRKPHKVGHLLLGAGAYASDFVSFIPLNVREHVDTEGGSLMALSICLFIVCLLSLVNQWRVRLCIHYYICKPQNGAWHVSDAQQVNDYKVPRVSSRSKEQSTLQTPHFMKWEIIHLLSSERPRFL